MKIGKDGNVESYECPAEREAFIRGNLHGYRGERPNYDGSWKMAYRRGYTVGRRQRQELTGKD